VDCLPCAVVAGAVLPPGGIILERHGFVLTHAIDVPLPGFFVLSSRRHVESLGDLHEEEARHLGVLLRLISRAIERTLCPDRVYCCSVGENIRHLHFYFFPRTRALAHLENGVAIFPKAVRLAKAQYSMAEKLGEIEAAVAAVRRFLEQDSAA
jgi:diadenosine tetraphosphate (Ap4A) HIT family hydrolase